MGDYEGAPPLDPASLELAADAGPSLLAEYNADPHKFRTYQSILPGCSKLLSKKWDERNRKLHRERLRGARADVDNKPPPTYLHLHLKLKKLQVEEERLENIERQNRLLITKMSNMMRRPGTLDKSFRAKSRSLNGTLRKLELMRITHENQAILKRIQSKQPHYDHRTWEEQWNIHEHYLRNISAYPYKSKARSPERLPPVTPAAQFSRAPWNPATHLSPPASRNGRPSEGHAPLPPHTAPAMHAPMATANEFSPPKTAAKPATRGRPRQISPVKSPAKATSPSKAKSPKKKGKNALKGVVDFVFALLDRDGSGFLEKAEFTSVLSKALNLRLSDEDVGAIMNELDVNEDGKISYGEIAPVIQSCLSKIYTEKGEGASDWCKLYGNGSSPGITYYNKRTGEFTKKRPDEYAAMPGDAESMANDIQTAINGNNDDAILQLLVRQTFYVRSAIYQEYEALFNSDLVAALEKVQLHQLQKLAKLLFVQPAALPAIIVEMDAVTPVVLDSVTKARKLASLHASTGSGKLTDIISKNEEMGDSLVKILQSTRDQGDGIDQEWVDATAAQSPIPEVLDVLTSRNLSELRALIEAKGGELEAAAASEGEKKCIAALRDAISLSTSEFLKKRISDAAGNGDVVLANAVMLRNIDVTDASVEYLLA